MAPPKSPFAAEATRTGVQSSVDAIGYVSDRAAADLGTRVMHTVRLVVCEITIPSYAVLAAGIDEAFDQAAWVAFVTAVLSLNDLCTLGVMLGLSDPGLAPGDDVAVVDFDNISEGARRRSARTTVAIGAGPTGEEAARLLLRRINRRRAPRRKSSCPRSSSFARAAAQEQRFNERLGRLDLKGRTAP